MEPITLYPGNFVRVEGRTYKLITVPGYPSVDEPSEMPVLQRVEEKSGLEKAIEKALKDNCCESRPKEYGYDSLQVSSACKQVVTDLINNLNNLIEKEASIDDIQYAVEIAKWCGK